MARAKGWENWPYNLCWKWIPSTRDAPGRARISEDPTGGQKAWDIHIRHFDAAAQKHQEARVVKPGLDIEMPDGLVLEVPYRQLDDDSDLMLQRNMHPSPDREPITMKCLNKQTGESVTLEKVSRDYWEKLVAEFIKRKAEEPPVTLDMGNGQKITMPFVFWDGMCKDFTRRRGDFIAAGWFPELLVREQVQKGYPPPVGGRANALGENISIPVGQAPPGQNAVPVSVTPPPAPNAPAPHPGQPPAPPSQAGQGAAAHPGLENEDLM